MHIYNMSKINKDRFQKIIDLIIECNKTEIKKVYKYVKVIYDIKNDIIDKNSKEYVNFIKSLCINSSM